MRIVSPLALCLALMIGASAYPPGGSSLPVAGPNDNTAAAGALKDGVLTIALEARRVMWHPDGDSLPGVSLAAFAEEARPALVPGPLIRVVAGTEVRLTVRNSLGPDTLTFHFPSLAKGAATSDSLVIPPGEVRELRARAAAPGNYLYRARMNDWLSRGLTLGGLMTGAIIVDEAGVPRPRDRVLVLLTWADSVNAAGIPTGRIVFAINGRSWPHTERLSATVGDTVRWRVLNPASEVHPMHLHGFYFRVDELSGPLVQRDGQGHGGRMVVTERMSAYSTMSVTWVPERAGNWLFHCHFQIHVVPHAPLDSAAQRTTGAQRAAERRATHAAHDNHSLTGMGGLVLGIRVKPRPGERAEAPAQSGRTLRLVATRDAAYPDSAPSMRFGLEEPAAGTRVDAGAGFSPPILLTRGEPVSITVVNGLSEPTAIHWHGIELDSYYDGVAGFGGDGRRISPIIAPRDSFVARFTPPRAGTFMYHSHIDEPRQQRAGLVGALIVRERGASTSDDHTFFIKSARAGAGSVPVLDINGQANPDTVVLAAGRPARLRFLSLALFNPNATVTVTARLDSVLAGPRDTLVVQWRPVAKDGADLPEAARAPRAARQIISMGETYDYELVPRVAGPLRIEVRAAGPRGALLARVPVRVE
jgi:FtsP/CotA-like multicopper oxidase with cupredoxin domain